MAVFQPLPSESISTSSSITTNTTSPSSSSSSSSNTLQTFSPIAILVTSPPPPPRPPPAPPQLHLQYPAPATTPNSNSNSTPPAREGTTELNELTTFDTATTSSSFIETFDYSRLTNKLKPRKSTSSINSSKQYQTSVSTLAALAQANSTNTVAISSRSSTPAQAPSDSLYYSTRSLPPIPTNNRKRSGDSSRDREEHRNSSRSASRSPSSQSRSNTLYSNSLSSRSQSFLEPNPPSQAYTDSDADTLVPTAWDFAKMHQTSSRLLRMTSDDRPFTRDFKDLFATLVVSLPLAPHRVRLTRVDHSFLSEEAINNLGSLKFSQSNRMPDPKDPSRIVTTTTTTTFSMAREMARSVCQRFLDARFIESSDGKQAKEFTMKSSVWQLTPKGICVLERFCTRNGILQKHVTEVVNSPRNTMQLVILERDSATDKLSSDRSTIEVIFRRFVGQNGPNVKNSTSSADSESLSEYKDGIAGVRMASERKVGSPPRVVHQTFTGKAATDWLMDCCSTVDKRETTEVASMFLDQELIWCVQSDRAYLAQYGQDKDRDLKFQPTKHAIYQLSQKGRDVLNMTLRERTSTSEAASSNSGAPKPNVSRDSNTQKLEKILNDAALRLLFRENLRDTHCEENLSFYLDVDEFLRSCRAAIKANSPRVKTNAPPAGQNNLDSVKETMASAYGIYNAFLAPGSPCELNIDHMLRNQLATRMTKAVGQDAAMIESLREVTKLFEEAQISVFKLMASDSVPKFMKSPKFEPTLKNYDFDSIAPRFHTNVPERSGSKSAPSSTRGT